MFGRRPFNTNADVRRVRRIGSVWNRSFARWNGRADGKILLYGPDTTARNFQTECQWLRKQHQRAAEIQTRSNQNVAAWIRHCEDLREERIKELEILDQKIAKLMQDSAETHCKLLAVMFFFEFLFSAVSLSTSGLGAIGFEFAIAIIAAAALVSLSEIVGKGLRQLPLAPSAEPADRIRHIAQIVLCSIALCLILVGVNFLRSLTGLSDTGDTSIEAGNQIVHWALFAVGLGLVLVGIFRSSDHEYSGPRFGLAKLQRKRQQTQRMISFYESTIRRLTEFPSHLQLIADASVQKVFAIYSDKYKRRAQRHLREMQGA